jgi:hypothetical protein
VKIAIVRRAGRKHDGIVTRDNGSTDRFVVYDYGAALPHDLVHYVAERARNVRFGFWGLVAGGARLAALETAGARNPRTVNPSTDPLVTEHLDELLAAEELANAAHDDPELRPLIDALNERWQAIPVDAALDLEWETP